MTTLQSIRRNWILIAAFAGLCAGWGKLGIMVHENSQEIETIQQTHPDITATEVKNNQEDVRDIKRIVERIDGTTNETKGEVEGLNKRIDDFNEHIARVESRIDAKR